MSTDHTNVGDVHEKIFLSFSTQARIHPEGGIVPLLEREPRMCRDDIIKNCRVQSKYGFKNGLKMKSEECIDQQALHYHEYLISKTKIKKFFHKEAPRAFAFEYETEIIHMLTVHLLEEIQERFCPENTPLTDSNITLSEALLTELSQHLTDRLGECQVSELMMTQAIDNDSEDETINTTYTLKKYDQLYVVLETYVKQKLEKEEYSLPYHELTEKNKSKIKNLRLRGNATLSELIQLNQALSAYDNSPQKGAHLRALLQDHQKTLALYPELFLSKLEKNPSLALLLPKRVRANPLIWDGILRFLDTNLQVAIKNKEEQSIHALLNICQQLTQHNPILLTKLSVPVQNNPLVQSKLHKQLELLKKTLIKSIFTQSHLSPLEVMQLIQMLKPQDLIPIIRERKRALLSPLPFCENAEIIKQFITSLDKQEINFSNNNGISYFMAKKQACERVCFSLDGENGHQDSAATYLATTDYWFLAMLRYFHARNSHVQNKTPIAKLIQKLLIKSLTLTLTLIAFYGGTLIGAMGVIASDYCIYHLMNPRIFFAVNIILSLLCLITCVFIYLLPAHLPMTTKICLGLAITSIVLMLSKTVIVILTILFAARVGIDSFLIIKDIYNLLSALVNRSIATLFSLSLSQNMNQLSSEEKCLNLIFQLNANSSESAHEKAEVLETLFDNMKLDAQKNQELNQDATQYLTKSYTFFYHDKYYTTSFDKVAAMPWENDSSFVIADKKKEKSASRFGFFSAFSEKIIPAYQDWAQSPLRETVPS